MSDDELKSLFEALRQDNVGIRQELGGLRQEVDGIRQENTGIREEIVGLRQEVDGIRQENTGIREEIVGLRQDNFGIRQEIVAVRQENEAAHVVTRRHFDVVAEASKHETQQVAESVALTREALDREAADIRAEVRRTASETQAMLKFSHAELDRRMRTLEDAVSDLQARVDRLETSTH